MSTKKYLQNGKWPGIKQDQTVKLSQVEGDLEIDVDIEKQIAQLQEARLAGEIEKPKELSIDPEKQLNEWHLEKGLKTFLANVEFEKEDLDKKIKEEDAKISALEELFGGLINKPKTKEEIKLENTEVISEDSFNELSEEEKKEREKIRLKALGELFEKKVIEEKIEEEKEKQKRLEEERKQKLLINSGLEKPKVILDEETIKAQQQVKEKYGQAGAKALQGLMNASAKEIEADPHIIDKVLSHISEMKVANELDKDKMKSLQSIDSLDKLTKEFLNFKNLTSIQLSTVGGGLDPNKISADLLPTTSGAFDLGSAARPWRKLFLTGGTLIIGDAEISSSEIAQLDGVTAGQATASKAVILDSESGVTGLGTVGINALSLGGTSITATAAELNIMDGVTATTAELNHVDGVTGNIQTALDSKATKAFAIAQAVALG
jgi:copper chaperone CopZ